MDLMQHHILIREQIDRQLNTFDLKTGEVEELADGSWSCPYRNHVTGILLGRVKGDKHSSIRACLELGFEMHVDYTKGLPADIMVVTFGSRV